jgi:tRNA pseudouridine38-40 synthase
MKRLEVFHEGPWIKIELEADGFLYNMARAIVGTMVKVARRKMPLLQVSQAIETKDRELAGPTMPAHGLFLVRVDYPT